MSLQLVVETKIVKVIYFPLRLVTTVEAPLVVWAQLTKNDGVVGSMLLPSFQAQSVQNGVLLLIDTVKSPVLKKGYTYTVTVVGQSEVSSGSGDVSDVDVESADIVSTDVSVTLDGENVRGQIQQLLDEVTAIEAGGTVADTDVTSANLTSTDTTITIDGSTVRGQLLDILDEITSISVSVADTDVTSADITSSDNTIVLDSSNVRGQFQQLIDEGIQRIVRHNEMSRVMESLVPRSGMNSLGTAVLGKLIRFTTSVGVKGRWAIFNSTTSNTWYTTGFTDPNLEGGGVGAMTGFGPFISTDAVYNAYAGLTFDQFGTMVIVGPTGWIRSRQGGGAFSTRTPDASYVGDWVSVVSLNFNGFVLAGTGGEIQTSLDGITFVRRYNTGGDFVSATTNDNFQDIVCVRTSSFVHSPNGGVSGFTDGALPLTGVKFVSYHKAFGFLVAGTNGTALSVDGLNWTQVETSQITVGTLKGLYAVAGGFVAWDDDFIRWTCAPNIVGSWVSAIDGRPSTNVFTYLGVDVEKRHVYVIWRDHVAGINSNVMSLPGRYA